MHIYDCIKKIPHLPDGIQRDDINAIYAYAHKPMAEDIKRLMTERRYTELRSSLKKNYDLFDQRPDNLHNLIKTKMTDTFIDLLN